MKRFVVCLLLVALSLSVYGCKKKEAVEDLSEPMTMEALSTMNVAAPGTAEVKAAAAPVVATAQQQVASAVAQANLEPLPPAGPYKPTAIEIQTALKNAAFYTGAIDGKVGPMTKKAIEAFQTANGLQADGKVGPKTWAALGKFLNPAPAPTAPAVKIR
jgi:peptidoglycan hydrolase-like protein with peptidoglycan-binding domain